MRWRVPALSLSLAALACVGRPQVGLLPPFHPNAPRRDPDRSLVERVPPPDRDRDGAERDPLVPESVEVSIAALALWIISGTLPLVGVFGRFEETRPFVSPIERRPDRPGGRDWRASPGCPAFLCSPDPIPTEP